MILPTRHEPRVELRCELSFSVELGTEPRGAGRRLHRESIQDDLGDLIEETVMRGILAGRLPEETEHLTVLVTPRGERPPWVDAIAVRVASVEPEASYELEFRAGRWLRRSEIRLAELTAAGELGAGQRLFASLLAGTQPTGHPPLLPLLLPPEIAAASLEELGVRELDGSGELDPERPVLASRRMVEEILSLTEAAGASETGGAMLGRIARLTEPLAGCTTRLVTVLTQAFADRRHVGVPGRFTFHPEALAEAAARAELRGRGEVVLTAFHSHGWGTGCGRCNQDERCALPPCTEVSSDDYRLLESLFPSKATLLPIAGRKPGAADTRPVLEIHAWQGGRVLPIPWVLFSD